MKCVGRRSVNTEDVCVCWGVGVNRRESAGA